MAGTPTTHIRAKVNVSALLADVSTFLGKAAASGATGTAALPTSLSPATRQKIASEIKKPEVDIWTGATDKTLRKLAIGLDIPVSGSASTLLGGLTSAQIQLSLQYSQLNQPQSVATPTNVKPFAQFQQQIQGILGTIEGLGGASWYRWRGHGHWHVDVGIVGRRQPGWGAEVQPMHSEGRR